jgi:isoleucyl-tRNA synthetase
VPKTLRGTSMFEEITHESFSEREEGVLDFWNSRKVFLRSIEERKGAPPFIFYDGPPFATGLPHYGHLLAGTIKDVIPRYKTMKGFCVPRRFGWDCHGLPIENEIEKAFNLSGSKAIEEFGIANFNEECRKIVLRYTAEWRETVNRMGRWVDFDKTYHTMDLSFMESVWWVFKQLYDKGLVYEGFRVMPFSAKLGTPLSNFEAGENYKDVDDPALTVALQLVDDPQTHLWIWTTTPWTLVSNLAVLVGPDIDYVKIRDKKSDQNHILAASRLAVYYPEAADYELLSTFKGSTLNGVRYQPLFDYFADKAKQGAFRVILEPSVSTEDGTGLVHAAPAFGEVDFYACQRENIAIVCPVDNNGRFTKEIPEYLGQFVKDADKDIIRRLKKDGKVIHHATCHHRYPFCWRSDTPLIYKAMRTWFVAVEKIKDKLLAANEKIHWTPEHIKYGRFGKWLEAARDWNISRNRYWGTPIPIWRADDGEMIVVGSIAELENLAKCKVTDLHRHFIDDFTITHNGKTFRRIPEVFDCWFESGSMPYAQNHYPFENKALFESSFPADFIGEGLDQTRGWFYTLTILSAALFDQPAFKNVIVNGILLAADGTKMSKRLKNYPDPGLMVSKYGADAVRLYMLHSPAVKADDLCFKEGGVELVLRQVLIPLWNAYSFFITYARIYKWKPHPVAPVHSLNLESNIDGWMLSLLNKLIKEVEQGMDRYDLSSAVEPFVGFVDQLTNWYIRRSRRRFWSDEGGPDRDHAFATLYYVLLELTKIAAPFVPFISEEIYRNLRSETMPESVHLCDYPQYRPEMRDEGLEKAMDAVQVTVSLGHSLRKDHKLKVRQPLAKAHIATADAEQLSFLQQQQHLIADELNVKEVSFTTDEKSLVHLKAKPNFRVLGKKVGKLMKAAQQAIEQFDQSMLAILMSGKNVTLTLEGEEFQLTPEDVQVEREVHEGMVAAHADKITIALDTALTPELVMEGLAREIVNKINTMRRDANFSVTDRIHVKIEATAAVEQAFKQFENYITGEVLAVRVDFGRCEGVEWDLNGEMTKIELHRIDG